MILDVALLRLRSCSVEPNQIYRKYGRGARGKASFTGYVVTPTKLSADSAGTIE
jgi:hypothetical protein